jgi:hypothetical protein
MCRPAVIYNVVVLYNRKETKKEFFCDGDKNLKKEKKIN